MMGTFIDMTGQRFGRLTVLERSVSATGRRGWRVRCNCGVEKVVLTEHIRQGRVVSCGCYAAEVNAARQHKHGMAHTPEHKTWSGIKNRCLNPKTPAYKDYGGRGITVCDRWRDSFEAFLADMGPRPSPGHSIDRIDNNKGYEPGNCRWATYAEQARNYRRNVFIEHDGVRLCMRDWAARLGLSEGTIAERLRRGWSPARAVTQPRDPRGKVARKRVLASQSPEGERGAA